MCFGCVRTLLLIKAYPTAVDDTYLSYHRFKSARPQLVESCQLSDVHFHISTVSFSSFAGWIKRKGLQGENGRAVEGLVALSQHSQIAG